MITEVQLQETMAETIKIPPNKEKKENLKQRAYLNSLSSMIDYAGIQITGFIINPFIVSGLGSSMYGVWQMLGQMTGYAKMADSRATQVLKWSLASKRDITSAEEFKSDVTTAMVVTAFSLPFTLLIGAIISWYAPTITQADAKYHRADSISWSFCQFGIDIRRKWYRKGACCSYHP